MDITAAVIFRDSRGDPVARGFLGQWYIVPESWVIQRAPVFELQRNRARWIRMWQALPMLGNFSWLDDLLPDRLEHKAAGMRLVQAPCYRREEVIPLEISEPMISEAKANLLERDSLRLRAYLGAMKRHGSVKWWTRNYRVHPPGRKVPVPTSGFTLTAGEKWVSYEPKRKNRWDSNLGW